MLMRKVRIIEKDSQEELAYTLAPNHFKDSQILQSMYQSNINVYNIMNTNKDIIMVSEIVAMPEHLYPETLPEEVQESMIIRIH